MPESSVKRPAQKRGKPKAGISAHSRDPNRMEDGKFARGNKLGGGAQPGAGRPPNWLKERVKEILTEARSVKVKTAEGREEIIISSTLEEALEAVHEITCNADLEPKDRLKAAQTALEYAVGRPNVSVEVSGKADLSMTLINQAAASAGVKGINDGE